MKFKIENLKLKIDLHHKNLLIFIGIFISLGFIALQIPINQLVGSRVKFTLFDLYGPIAGAFLGTTLGIIAVLAIQITNLVVSGINNIEKGSIIRLVPTLFAVWFFALGLHSRRRQGFGGQAGQARLILLVPVLSIFAFNLHPVGRTVWFYSLFWLIPLLVWPFKERFLLLRGLGATFTAHAVGGAIWIWAFNLPANVWIALIPVVILERGIFALGISASYILINNLLAALMKERLLTGGFSLDKKYVLKFLR